MLTKKRLAGGNMTILNLIMTVISFILLILCIMAPFRKSGAARGHQMLQAVLKPHTIYGILLLVTSLVHGILSGNNPAMMSGKPAWLCLLILLIFSAFKGKMKTRNWIKIHRVLSVLLCLLIVVHIVHAIVV